MRSELALILLLCFSVTAAWAQGLQTINAPAFRITGGYSFSKFHPSYFTNNPALLADIKNFSFSLYGGQPYRLKELSIYSAALAFAMTSSHFGCSMAKYGNALYHETDLGLYYARRMGNMDAGAGFHYQSAGTHYYGNMYTVIMQAGMMFHPAKELKTGFQLYFPATWFSKERKEENLPGVITTGLGWDLSENLNISIVIEKMEDLPMNLETALHYRFNEKMDVRAGLSATTSECYMGFGLLVKRLRMEVQASLHPNLGISPGLLLTFQSGRE